MAVGFQKYCLETVLQLSVVDGHLGEINLEARHSPGDQTISATHCWDHTKGGQGPKLGVVLVKEPGEELSINSKKH